jgi:hypothetical protein
MLRRVIEADRRWVLQPPVEQVAMVLLQRGSNRLREQGAFPQAVCMGCNGSP